MTIDQAIIRAAECAAEDRQTFYVYHRGPQHFVSPQQPNVASDWEHFDLLVNPNGTVELQRLELDEICLCGAGLNTDGECEVDDCPVAPQAV